MSRISKKVILSPYVYGALLVLLCARTTPGFVPLQASADEQPDGISAIAILNKASQIAVGQDKQQAFWCDRVLQQIADIQTRAQDFDGARKTIRSCGYPYGRNAAFVELAEALARVGQREQAFEVLRELGTDHGWRQDYVEDGVRMFWIEYLINDGELKRAREAVAELVAPKSLPEGLRKLAVAHAKRGDETGARRLFERAFTAASAQSDKFVHVSGISALSDEYYRAIAIWEVAQAQSVVADFNDTLSTIQQLVQHSESSKSGLSKVGLLREAAVLAAGIGDRRTAKRLFRQAIDSRDSIRPPIPCAAANRIVALNKIAKAQVNVGYFDDALKTARLIKVRDSSREEVLRDIAIAQANTGDMEQATASALSIEHYIQYENDALFVIVDLYIGKGDKESALMTAEKIANPSRKAAAILKVATEYAKDGDKNKAKAIAGRIQLKAAHNPFLLGDEVAAFDFTKAETWGVMFDQRPYFTSLSHSVTVNRAAELAAAVMTLNQAFDEPQDLDYAVVFQDVHKDVIQSLARAHATNGDAKDAFAWASRIGSDEKIGSENDHDSQVLVEQRIHALIGVAEGLLAN